MTVEHEKKMSVGQRAALALAGLLLAAGVIAVAVDLGGQRTQRVAEQASRIAALAQKTNAKTAILARRADHNAAVSIENGNRSACGFRLILRPLLERTKAAELKAKTPADRASAHDAIKTYQQLLDSQRTEPRNLNCTALIKHP